MLLPLLLNNLYGTAPVYTLAAQTGYFNLTGHDIIFMRLPRPTDPRLSRRGLMYP